jgi:hypothetical protein
MRARALCPLIACLVAAACGGAAVSLPVPVRGIWGNNCASPVIRLTEDSIHIYADNATYALTGATFNGNDLTIRYASARGEVSETYMKSGETLRLDHGTYAGADIAFNRHAMNRCP